MRRSPERDGCFAAEAVAGPFVLARNHAMDGLLESVATARGATHQTIVPISSNEGRACDTVTAAFGTA